MFDINTKHLPDRKSHENTNNYIVSVIGIGQLVFKILVIGIAVKSHIGTTLAMSYALVPDEAADVSHNGVMHISVHWVVTHCDIHGNVGLMQLPGTKSGTFVQCN